MKKQFYFLLILLLGTSYSYSATFYVNGLTGDNSFNGSSASVGSFPIGPKKTIKGAIAAAQQNDNIVIAGGTYLESCVIKFSINVITSGVVQIKSIIMDGANKTLNFIGLNVEVLDTLSLKEGKIDVSTGINLIIKPTCKVLGGSKNSYVDGPLTLQNTISGKRNLFFPIGNKKDYRPVILNLNQLNTNLNVYKVQLYNLPIPYNNRPSSINRVSKVHYWNISKNGSSSVKDMEVTLHYDTTFNNDEVLDYKYLRILHDSASILNNLGGNATSNIKGKITIISAKEKWGNFTLGNDIQGVNSLGHTLPFARFGSNGLCEGAPIKMLDSTISTLSITDHYWVFNYGNSGSKTSTARNPVFISNASGSIPILYRVTNTLGEKDSIIKNISIRPKPKNNFQVTNTCFGDTSLFINSTTSTDSVYAWYWLVNGAFSNKKEPKMVIIKRDTSIVRLISTSIYNCTDTLIKKVAIHSKPNVEFTYSRTCLGDTTLFTNNSTIWNDTILKWSWEIDDVLNSNSKFFNIKFNTSKIYNVKLKGTSANNCTDSSSKMVTVNAYPVPSFDLSVLNGNDSIQCYGTNKYEFTSYSSNSNPEKLQHTWLTEQGDTKTDSIFTTSFTGDGLNWVRLIVENSSGCIDSLTKTYEVLPKITSSFSSYAPCFPDSVTFYPFYITPLDNIDKVKWDFGDGNTVNSEDSFKYQYANAGTYSVKMFIETINGCLDTTTQSMDILSTPNAKIQLTGSNEICLGDSILLKGSGGKSYRWEPSLSTKNDIWVNVSQKVLLRASSSNSCFGYDSVNIIVHPLPIANAGIDTAVTRGKSITLNGTGGTKYLWSPVTFLNSDAIQSPICSATSSIKYQLEVTDANGCKDTDSIFVNVKEPEFIKIVNLLSPNGDGDNDFWVLSDLPQLNTCTIQVYNRNGQIVFESNNYNNDWEGTYEGKPLPSGSYFYYIKCGSEDKDFKGTLLILR